jgi:hypothetical protein
MTGSVSGPITGISSPPIPAADPSGDISHLVFRFKLTSEKMARTSSGPILSTRARARVLQVTPAMSIASGADEAVPLAALGIKKLEGRWRARGK